MKKVLFAFLFIGCLASAQTTTVYCDPSHPITYSFPAIASAVPSSDGTITVITAAQPASSITCYIGTVSTPPPSTPPPAINPIVQKADCTVTFGNKCTVHLGNPPAIGHNVILFASASYGPANLSSSLNSDVNLPSSSQYPPDQLIASKLVGSSADQVQDYVIKANSGSYFKAIVVEVQGLASTNWFDIGSSLFDQRYVSQFSANLTTLSSDYVFAMTHGSKGDFSDDTAEGWVVVDKITDSTFKDVLLLQYKPALAGNVTVNGAVTTSGTTQNFESVMAAYKQVQ